MSLCKTDLISGLCSVLLTKILNCLFFFFSFQWEEGLRETYPHIVHEELSEGNLYENSAHVNDNCDILEGKYNFPYAFFL